MFIFILIFIHELGHFETARVFNFEVDKIYLYPTGGISKFTSRINVSWYKELLVLINGPLSQIIIYFLLIRFYPYENSLITLKYIHYSILLFNLLPIYPLDGGKVLNLFLNRIFSFKTSFNLTIIFSYIFIFLLLIIINFSFKINYLFVISFLIYKLVEEQTKFKYYYDKFLLERYLYSFSFNKICVVPSFNKFRKNYEHIISNNRGVFLEKEELNKKFSNFL